MKTHGKANVNIEKISEAILEAERFILKAKEAKKRLLDNDVSEYTQYSFKEMGALKRSALDLGRVCTGINQIKSF